MAPMTRSRATQEGVATELMQTYYAQRSTAGLIISEAINISPVAIGGPFIPGLYTEEQTESWKKITTAIHSKNSFVFAQLNHSGRVSHSIFLNGSKPKAPSAIANSGKIFSEKGLLDFETPEALTVLEIEKIIQDYRHAVRYAVAAGFDGAELHAAYGYLPNQFLSSSSNTRTDEYGGSIENRCRFVIEVLQAMIDEAGENKIGIRLSPNNHYNSMWDENSFALYDHLAAELKKLPLAYVHVMERRPDEKFENDIDGVTAFFRSRWKGTLISSEGYKKDSGNAAIENGLADLIAFGTAFISNPDLPKRFEKDFPLNEVNRKHFYGGNHQGYIDYPEWK